MTFIDMIRSLAPGLPPFHLLAYSTLLGTQLYQSFVMTKIAHQTLPRSLFTTFQKRVFPIYFQGQSLLLVLAAITVPPYGPLSLAKEKWDLIPWVISATTAGLNLMVYGPRTKQAMIDRTHQETRDALKSGTTSNDGRVSDDMRRMNRIFSRVHAMSIHLNLITIGATLWYGWRLASRIKIEVK